mgnify:CR=1 FL=1
MGLITEEKRGAILIWTLDREARLNALPDLGDGDEVAAACERVNADPVSYTHLTLPTICSV